MRYVGLRQDLIRVASRLAFVPNTMSPFLRQEVPTDFLQLLGGYRRELRLIWASFEMSRLTRMRAQ